MSGDVTIEGRDEHANTVVFVCDVGMASNPERQYGGEFRAHGPAVVNGLMCEHGQLQGTFGEKLDGYFDFTVSHRLTCPDGASGVVVTLKVKMYQPKHTYFEWEITEGLGHHGGLGGSGMGVGTESRLGRDAIRDHLFGHLEPHSA